MGLDLWFREDILRVLRSQLSQAMRHDDGSEYHRGYRAALEDMAIAFGLDEIRSPREVVAPK